MESFKALLGVTAVFGTLLVFLFSSANAQISTACTNSMITSFTPCINYITGSTSNGASSPSADCCNSVKSLMSTSLDCACLLLIGNVPVSFPFNRSLALSLPRACHGGVPIQCEGSGVPPPAPASKASAMAQPPAAKPTLQTLLASPPLVSVAPTANPGIRPVVTTTSASNPSHISAPFVLLIFVGIMVSKFY
ncbi:unnamed protein product [Ilex paraguariensis]|uniref:Bifunctional inhibitor/plant lipid transfer protein/seed storage helical domain-containing protein n=1 Tax=Ilex paraguariensis TaxID=185542 RepID=A0ABC8RRC0_9AQUA